MKPSTLLTAALLAGLAPTLCVSQGFASNVLYVNPVESYPNHIYQIDPNSGSYNLVVSPTSYAGGGIYMNGNIYYQSNYFSPSLAVSAFNLSTGTTAVAFTNPAGADGSYIANSGMAGDSANNRLFFSYYSPQLWVADVSTFGGTATSLLDATTVGFTSIIDVAYSKSTSTVFISGSSDRWGLETQIARGTEVNGSFSWEVIVSTAGNDLINHIAIDDTNASIYWTGGGSAKLRKSNLDGTSITDVLTGTPFYNDIAVDGDEGVVFLAPRDSGSIVRVDLDGGNFQALADVGGFASSISVGESVPEPSTWALLGFGAIGFALFGRRRRASKA